MEAKLLSKAMLSKILILAGCLCIAASVGYELVNYPWASVRGSHVNEVELRDPAPPNFDYIDYRDIPAPAPEQDGDAAKPGESEGPEEPEEPGEQILPGETETGAAAPAPSAAKPSAASRYVLLGIVKIPRISVSGNLFEGTAGQLDVGIGHVERTAMPGERGNSVIAAHRVVSFGKPPFRHLDKLSAGDVVTVKFNEQTFTYEVFDQFIVTKHDVWVLLPLPEETHALTLITCDPVISSGSRANRLIVRARLTLVDGLPPESASAQTDAEEADAALEQSDAAGPETAPSQDSGDAPGSAPPQEDAPSPVDAPPASG